MEFSQLINFLISLVVICNPVACLPVLLCLSQGKTIEEKRRTGLVAASAAAIIFFVVIWMGKPLLDFLSIRVAAFQVAGGVILFLIALSMLNAETLVEQDVASGDVKTIKQRDSIAIVPLAMPLIAGPGAISLVLVTVGNFPSFPDRLFLTSAALVVSVFLGIVLYSAVSLEKIFGLRGLNAINRIAGLILAAMAVETFAKGMTGLFPTG